MCCDGDVVALLPIRSVWTSELVTALLGTLQQTQTTHILYPPIPSNMTFFGIFLSQKNQIIFTHGKLYSSKNMRLLCVYTNQRLTSLN